MNKKRLLVISNMYPGNTSSTFGIFVKVQVDALIKSGLQVDVLAIVNPSSKKIDIITKYLFWVLKAFLFLLQGYKYHTVHVHYVFPSGIIGILFKKLCRCKLVVTAHGGDINKMAKKNERIKKWTKYILNSADHVIAVGKGLYDEIHGHYNVDINKLSLLSMGVNREIFRPSNEKLELRKRFNLPKNNKVILFVGNLIPDKGIMELVEAFSEIKKQFPGASLHLIGPSKSQTFLDKVYSKIKDKEIEDVHFQGSMSQKEIANWMNVADVFVLPSHKEGFGLVALEAMACETPVVGTETGGLSYLLSDGCGILVRPGDTNALSEGIFEVISNAELRGKLIKMGTVRAKEHDQIKIIQRILEIYKAN
jgi:glycosyltransferase involved in cell wall biosynthesis